MGLFYVRVILLFMNITTLSDCLESLSITKEEHGKLLRYKYIKCVRINGKRFYDISKVSDWHLWKIRLQTKSAKSLINFDEKYNCKYLKFYYWLLETENEDLAIKRTMFYRYYSKYFEIDHDLLIKESFNPKCINDICIRIQDFLISNYGVKISNIEGFFM